VPQPANDTFVRRLLRRLTQNVRIDEISHNVSVGSD
jgi:hypothetical protein